MAAKCDAFKKIIKTDEKLLLFERHYSIMILACGGKSYVPLYFVASRLVAFAAVAARLRAQRHEHVLGKE